MGATLGDLFFKKKANTLTQKENVKLNRIHQLYTDIYIDIFGMIDGDENDQYALLFIVFCFFFTLLVLPSLYKLL